MATTFIEKKIRPSDGREKDNFAWSVAIWGNYAIAGSIWHKVRGQKTAGGAAYMYRRTNSGWVEHIKLAGRGITNRYGQSVAISANHAVVSTHISNDHPKGAVFVYKRTGGSTWVYQTTLRPPKNSAAVAFGHAVAVDGGFIAVSDVEDMSYGFPGGKVYVYRPHPNGTDWVLVQPAFDPGALSAGDAFGSSLSIRGYTMLVGAEGDEGRFLDTGAAYVYEYEGSPGTWVRTQKIRASDGSINDGFGHSVCLSQFDDWAIVGAWEEDAKGANAGAAYIFKNEGGTWIESVKLTGSDSAAGDGFGRSVAIEANRAIVGAWKHGANGDDAGAAYYYEFHRRTNWSETKILASNGDARDWFGMKVATHNLNLAVAATYDDDVAFNCGAAYIFEPKPTATLRRPDIFLNPWPYLYIYTGCADTVVNQPIDFRIRMPKGVRLSVAVSKQPRNGKIRVDSSSKTMRYTPDRNRSGNDTFILSIRDRRGNENQYVQTVFVKKLAGAAGQHR